MSDINISVTGTKRLKTAGKYCADDIVVTATGGGGGGAPTLQSKTVTPTKSQQTVTADSGYDGLSSVTVKPIPEEYIQPTGTKEITANGTFSIKNYAEASVNVQPNLQEKTATENGEVTPDTGYDGLSKVIVNVASSGGGSDKLAKIVDNTITELTAEDLQGATQIAEYKFYRCTNLSRISIPNSVTSIGTNAFYSCTGLTSVTIPNSVTSIGNSAFNGCTGLTSITIPNSVTSISASAFYNCTRLTSVTIGNGVETIGTSAFRYCAGLTSITIPNSVTSIDAAAFNGCTSMQYYDFTSHTSVPTLQNANAFTGISSTCEIRVPAALVDEWKNATNWSTYADHIVGVSSGGETRPTKTFTIYGTPAGNEGYEQYHSTFEFEEGMTFGEWSNSPYDIDGYFDYENPWGYTADICHDYGDSSVYALFDTDGNLITDDDVIIEGSGNYQMVYFDDFGEEDDTDNIEFFIQSSNYYSFNVPRGTKWIDVPSIIGTSTFKIEGDVLYFFEDGSWYDVYDVTNIYSEVNDGEWYYTTGY